MLTDFMTYFDVTDVFSCSISYIVQDVSGCHLNSASEYTTFKKVRLSGGILIKRTEARLVGHTRDCASMNMAGASSSCVLSEEDIPGASLNGRKPAELKNDDLKFWLKCRGDSAKGLKTKAQLIKRYHLWP